MLTATRKFAKSKWAIGLFVFLALGLLVTGGAQMGDFFGSFGPKHVISAGNRSVDAAQFRADMDAERQRTQEQAGRPVSFEDLVAGGRLTSALDQQANVYGFMAWAWDAGIRPGKELALRQIRQIPAFFDQVSGRFDEAQYETTLQRANLTRERFEQETQDQIVLRHYGTAIQAGLRLPRIYGAVVANQVGQTRDGRWFTVTQAMAGTVAAPTDAQLTTFIQQNANDFRVPELRKATLVVFSNPADGQGEIAETRIEERFNFRRDALSQPETRSFVTLTAPNKAAADRIAAALRSGQTPEAVAQANNIQPVVETDRPRTAVGDPAVAAAVFGMTPNQISDPIQARVGFVVAKLNGVTAGRAVTVNDVRAQIVDELRAEDIRGAVYERVSAYDKARQAGKTLEAAVAEIGARTLSLPAVTQDGRSMEAQAGQFPPEVLQTMWRLGRNGESEVIQDSQNGYFVVRIDEITPPTLLTLERPDVRAQIAATYTARENARRLTTLANTLSARVRGGEDIAAVASSAGATLETGANVSAQDQARGRGVIAGLFTSPVNQVFSQQQTEDSYVIGRTDRITAPVAATAANAAEGFRGRLTSEGLSALGESAIRSAATKVGATFDEALAREALGLPAEAAATPAGAPAPAPAPAR